MQQSSDNQQQLAERSRSRSHGRKIGAAEASVASEVEGRCECDEVLLKLQVVRMSGAAVHDVETTALERISTIKARLSQVTATPQAYQRLLYGTKELCDERTVAEEGLVDGAHLTFVRLTPTISSLHEILEDEPLLVPFLIEFGADPNDFDDIGWTALHWAADRRFLRVAEAITARSDFTEVNALGFGRMSALHTAAIRGFPSLCNALLNRPDFSLGNAHSKNGNTALMWAARSGHPKVCQVLLMNESYVAVNKQNCHGWTALHYAATSGMLEVCELLLNRSDFDATHELTLCGETSLHWAALNGHADICKLLLDRGVDPRIEDVDGLTALDGATSNGHKEVRELFLTMTTLGKEMCSPPQTQEERSDGK
mmetsp:Transcript_41999/g.94387  ORF Transcript_41999/g.94387 Transcript_41999/m.94387 type:complete len:370 (+) Transcript_41999:71-1180(+)